MFEVGEKTFWGFQSPWTRGKTSRAVKSYDGLKMFFSPEGNFDVKSQLTVKVVGIPSTRSRDQIFSNLELMCGDMGRIQAIFIEIVLEDGLYRYSGEGFVHAVSPDVARKLVEYVGPDGFRGLTEGGRTMKCEWTWREFDLSAHGEKYSDFGGPRFAIDCSRLDITRPDGEWEVVPRKWSCNKGMEDSTKWDDLFFRREGEPLGEGETEVTEVS